MARRKRAFERRLGGWTSTRQWTHLGSQALVLGTSTLLFAAPALGQCGGVERWAVKVAADPSAASLTGLTPVATSLHDLVHLPRPALPSDDLTRASEENSVRVVEGRLVRFKRESGKTGDQDFHLVITDETLQFSAGGAGSSTSPHSVIAEIPDPACVGGRDGAVTAQSQFAAQLAATRARFLQQFPNIKSGWNEIPGGIPVRLTGIVFYDRPHGQVGRALNGLELHPLIDIEFNPGTVAPITRLALGNGDFESGTTPWTASAGVISTNPDQAAHGGQGKAWLGGYGEAHTDRLSQEVALPATATAVTLSFFLHIDTEEEYPQPYDVMSVNVRDVGGQLLETVRSYSNLDASEGFAQEVLDLSAYAGATVRIEFVAQEDYRLLTSFVVDDVAVIVEGP